MSFRCLSLAAVVLFSVVPLVYADNAASGPTAKALTTLLDARKLDCVAARMPNESDRFVAALYVGNSQLLVVTARYGAPSLLQEKIWGHKYKDVYTALHGGGMLQGKFFVLDLAANGLPPKTEEDAQIDVVYEDGSQQTTFNNDWRGQKLSRTEYEQRLDAAEARYTSMLAALVAELKTAQAQ